MQGSFRSSDGVELAYHVDDFTDPWKEPEALILLHSMMGQSERFYRWVPDLAKQYRVIRMDMRGHGASQVPPENLAFSLERLVDDAVELLDHLGVKKLHVIGNSAGGYVAQKLAIFHADRVTSLALFGSTPGLKRSQTRTWIPLIQKEGLKPFLTRTIADRFPTDRTDPGLVGWFLEQTGACDQDFICRWLAHMSELEWSDELDRIRCPTLIAYAGGETVGAADHYIEMRERIHDCETLNYVGMPHNIADIVPERCVRDLLAFLERRFPKA